MLDGEFEISMRMGLRCSACQSVVLAAVAGLVLTLADPPRAVAGSSAPAFKGVSASTASSDATDFSSARRRHYRRGNNAAGLAFMGLAIGTIGAIAAQQRREDYDDRYGYYGHGPGYYGGEPYYDRRYYHPY